MKQPGEGQKSGISVLIALANILIAMRRDLGDVSADLSPRDILRTFINDIDEYVNQDGSIRK